MALFALLGVLRRFPAAAYRRTPHRKPLFGLDQSKNCSFLNWTLNWIHYISWMDGLLLHAVVNTELILMKNENILVVGGAGYIGSHMVKDLLD
ncbi:MAG TPA: hypothetical protein VLM43_18375, partial [Desulfobacterales bacterium]|nr:hypothetical protein [Desulfobacterales bacterium]